MKAATGIALSWNLDSPQQQRAFAAQTKALEYFPWLKRTVVEVGPYQVHLWGHGDPQDWLVEWDGKALFAVGCPDGGTTLEALSEKFNAQAPDESFLPPWDGSYLLFYLDSREQTLRGWNDWVGTYPAFHSQLGTSGVVSTLEPVVQQTYDKGPEDIHAPALASLFLLGHYLSDWTLYEGMHSFPADSFLEWKPSGFRSTTQWKTRPSDTRWNQGWDALTDEMHHLTQEAVTHTLKEETEWCLPLSGGMDSRLFAGVLAQQGADVMAYAYGPAHWSETLYSRQVANALDIPWKRVDLGENFLHEYTPQWAHWFGSALHFHGMYQLPFLEYLKSEPFRPVLLGHMGDTLAGNHLLPMERAHSETGGLAPLSGLRSQWDESEFTDLFRRPMDEALQAVRETTQKMLDAVDGAPFQRMAFFNFWNRQRLFISYQPLIYQTYRGVRLPYLSRDYANFCHSLPRLALEQRALQFRMLEKHFPTLAAIPSTFAPEPLKITGHYALKRKLAHTLPRSLRFGPLQEFNPSPNPLEIGCMARDLEGSVWPIPQNWEALESWIDPGPVKKAMAQAHAGDVRAVSKLQAVQTLAYRLT